jgi:acetaldehyde dehydrogenase
MRNAIHLRLGPHDADEVRAAIAAAVAGLQRYVPGYRTTAEPVMDADRVTVLTEVEGAGDHLPPYAGNLDVMTAAAVRVCEVAAGARAAR